MTRVHSLSGADVLVVGAGVVGLTATWRLLSAGSSVTLIAGEARTSASAASGAMLSIFSEMDEAQPDERVRIDVSERLAADALWRDWLPELERVAPILTTNGTWVVGTAVERRLLERMRAAALDNGRMAELHSIDEVPVRPSGGSAYGLWLPDERAVDSAQLLSALDTAVRAHPAALVLDEDVQSLSLRSAGPVVAELAGRTAQADAVVVAAGAATSTLLGDLAAELEVPRVLAARGSGLLVASTKSYPNTIRSPNRAFACGIHAVPRRGGCLYIGATNRFTALDDSMTDGAALDELAVIIHSAVNDIDDRLYSARLLSTQTGYRPFTLDRLPLVGRTADERVLLATATYRSGVVLAARIAELITTEILGSCPNPHPYSPRRRMDLPPDTVTLNLAAQDLIRSLIEPGGWIPPGVESRIAAFLALAMPDIVLGQTDDDLVERLRRQWAAAPVLEAVPALFREVHRARARD